MKLYFASALLLAVMCSPAGASSIELIDDVVTGTKGSGSIVTVETPAPCEKTACVDTSGGNPNLNTGAAQIEAALKSAPLKKINFAFARKFPDPAVPVPSVATPETSDGSAPLGIPLAPADSGTVAEQPPVGQSSEPAPSSAPQNASVQAEVAPVDPDAPVMPLANLELRDGE